ncbi:MAG TPA: hypothetical protein VG265_14660 [Gaiellaceae bacterium]|jgi:hypothetical protein|nr:hypothetical protein [Gaiellaceae bacterium]
MTDPAVEGDPSDVDTDRDRALEVAPRLLDAVREAQRTQRQGGPALRACFDDEARIESVAAGGAYDPDESVRRIEAAFSGGVYSPGEWEFEEIRPDVVLSSTNIRHRPPSAPAGQTVDAALFWLMTGRRGLIWRVRVFNSRVDALDALERHGTSLGL